ncbi:Fmp16 [Kluyveromyces lactis]|nr:Fmp16 [Kluyveromyces lactis]
MIQLTRVIKSSPVATQCLRRNFSASVMAGTTQKSKDPDQRMFDRNKKKLEELEHDTKTDDPNYKRPNVKSLKQKGKDAPIKQHRADDGVY